MEISDDEYQKLLAEIKSAMAKSGNSVTRSRVVMAHEIGQSIAARFPDAHQRNYGKETMKRLKNETTIDQKVLYKMRSFYQTYPKLPKDDEKLNWSHYRMLAGIKKSEERQALEDLTREKNWSTDQLAREIKKVKNKTDGKEILAIAETLKPDKKLLPLRGQLFSYRLVEEEGLVCLDLGFNIFREVKTDLAVGQVVNSVKNENGEYNLQSSVISSLKKLNIYQAKLIRVVDGDTLRVTLDLGFNVWHHQILRLRGINAPEMKYENGKESLKTLQHILTDVPFLVLRTTQVDQHGRYVCDVFFDEKKDAKTDPQKIADEGIYLNQLLLDQGSVTLWEK